MGFLFSSRDRAAHGLLREACAVAHARLDKGIARLDLTERAAYADALSRLSSPLSALESGLEDGAWPKLFDDWRARRRSDALRADLMQLGGPFMQAPALPILDEAEAFGALYMLESSRVGGRNLVRQISASGDPIVRDSVRFLRHAEGNGQWRSFLIALDASQAVSAHPKRAIEAALDAFDRFEKALA